MPQTVTYQFYNADWKETSVANHTADIKVAYDAGTSNWRYEATNYPYQNNGGTDAYNDVNDAINAAIAGKESVIDSNYYAASTQKNITDTGSFTFEADTEYVIVFKSVTKAASANTARLLLTALTATKAEEQEETTEPVDATAPTEDLNVNFKDDATTVGVTASTYFQDTSLLTSFNTAYEAESIQ